ncbi:hypothetical protein Tco_1549300 [Tanacetum coccineum]
MGLEAGSTFITPATQEAPVGAKSVIDPDLLSYAKPRKAPVAEDPDSKKSTSFASMDGSPGSIYQSGWGVTNNCRLDTLDVCQDMVDHLVPPRLGKRHKKLKVLLEAEADMKEAAEAKNAELVKELEHLRIQFSDLQVSNHQLSQQVSTLQAQVTGEERIKATFKEFKKYKDDRVNSQCAEIDVRLDALSIDFDEELYPHMLTAIVGHRWVIEYGLRLAVMKCAESTELRQVFSNVVSPGIAKGMSEGLKHRVEHRKAKLDLATIKAYDLEADTKYVMALHALNDLKYHLVDELEKLKDAPIDLIMASLYFESDYREDTPQWIQEILLKDAIMANISCAKKKKKYRVEYRLAILLADAATQTEISEDEASLRLL